MKTAPTPTSPSDFHQRLLRILVGGGRFRGDGKQTQIMLRRHARSLNVSGTLLRLFPASKLYGAYACGDVLRDQLVPLNDAPSMAEIDKHVYWRYLGLKMRYGL